MIEFRVYGLGAISIIPMAVYLILIVSFAVSLGLLLMKWGLRDGMQYSMRILLVEWVFLILCTAVIFRGNSEYGGINIIPLSSYFDIAENSYLKEKAALNVLNVALFVPVGLLSGLGYRGMIWKKMFLVSLSLSIMIELLQFIFKRGLCEIDDVIHNVLGAAIGFGIYCIFARIWSKVVGGKEVGVNNKR